MPDRLYLMPKYNKSDWASKDLVSALFPSVWVLQWANLLHHQLADDLGIVQTNVGKLCSRSTLFTTLEKPFYDSAPHSSWWQNPSVVVFKGAKNTGVLAAILKKLKRPYNLLVKSPQAAWWSELVHFKWIKRTFFLTNPKSVLIINEFFVRKMSSCLEHIEERNVRVVDILVGMTGKYQSLDEELTMHSKTITIKSITSSVRRVRSSQKLATFGSGPSRFSECGFKRMGESCTRLYEELICVSKKIVILEAFSKNGFKNTAPDNGIVNRGGSIDFGFYDEICLCDGSDIS